MRKLNLECLTQILVLLALDSLLFMALITDKMKYYVHPRIEKYVWFAVVALLIFMFSILPGLYKPKHKINIFPCMILIIPIMTGFTLQANHVSNDVPQIEDTTTSSNVEPKKSFNADEDFITVSDEDYVKWYMDAYTNPAKYDGKTVKIKGIVFKMEDFDQNEFVPARMSMVCCAADLAPYGFICKSLDAPKWKPDQWVFVTAKIKVEYQPHMKMELPVLYATEITKAEKPEEELIYPY